MKRLWRWEKKNKRMNRTKGKNVWLRSYRYVSNTGADFFRSLRGLKTSRIISCG